ncbi:hypothetical protein TNCV_4791211 [Trichonephila clavipes]|nr:hypothetical protein TNCV_4791211 [Trichonephila clavipes]
MHPYRIPIALQQEVDRQINELLHLKLIEPSESEWHIQLFVYSKRTGNRLSDLRRVLYPHFGQKLGDFFYETIRKMQQGFGDNTT